MMAELCRPAPADEAALAYEAIAEVPPGGHFFAAAHTMERYQTAFYRPLVADLSNYGLWAEHGSKPADERATAVWKKVLADFSPPPGSDDIRDRISGWIERHTAAGGQSPEG